MRPLAEPRRRAAAPRSRAASRSQPKRRRQRRRLALPAIDASLELDVEVQQELLDFAARLSRPYHEILGVPRDADARAIKKAYFALSKRLHPDRYFRRGIGAFAPLVETCFKKLLEAYELLSDPQTRVEVQRADWPRRGPGRGERARRRASTRAAACASAWACWRAQSARARSAAARRRASSRPGMASFAKERWLEAAGSVRLAIAFDPENEAYREQFAGVQRKAHDERARTLVKQAEGALEMRDFAHASTCSRRPCTTGRRDPGARRSAPPSSRGRRSASCAARKELAAHAVELAPDNGAYRRAARPDLQGRRPRGEREARARGRAAHRSAGSPRPRRRCVGSERVRREGMRWAE